MTYMWHINIGWLMDETIYVDHMLHSNFDDVNVNLHVACDNGHL